MQTSRIAQYFHNLLQMTDRIHTQSVDQLRLLKIRLGDYDTTNTGRARGHSHGQHAIGTTHGAIQSQFSHHPEVG